jgi:hypothetical protein
MATKQSTHWILALLSVAIGVAMTL